MAAGSMVPTRLPKSAAVSAPGNSPLATTTAIFFNCDFTTSLHKSTVSLLSPPVTMGATVTAAAALPGPGVTAGTADAPAVALASTASFLEHPASVKPTQVRPKLKFTEIAPAILTAGLFSFLALFPPQHLHAPRRSGKEDGRKNRAQYIRCVVTPGGRFVKPGFGHRAHWPPG